MQCQVIDVIIMSVCLSVCNVGGSGIHSLGWNLEILETNCTDN